MVTPLGNLEIAHVGSIAQVLAYTRMRRDRIGDESAGGQLRCELVQVAEAKEEVYFGDLSTQIVAVALHQAADRNDRLHTRALFQCGGFEDRLDRLPLGRVDEPTGVHENDVGVLERGHHLRAVSDEIADQPFRIDGRLVAAEGDDAESHGAMADGR